MARMNDYSDRDEAQSYRDSIRETVRNWLKGEKHPSEEGARQVVEETVDGWVGHHDTAWLIVHNFNLENDEPEIEPRDGTPNALATTLAYEYLVREGMDEWDDIEIEIKNNDLFYCKQHREWHETNRTCDDCGDPVCDDVLVLTPDGTVYCPSCAVDHLCNDCETVRDDADYNTDYGLILCDACSQKREEEYQGIDATAE